MREAARGPAKHRPVMARDGWYANKLSVIVGGSEGIGKAIAAEFSRRGCRVVLCARRLEVLEQARSEIADDGKAVTIEAFDVADAGAVQGGVERILARDGVPDILVNCAGFAHPGWLDAVSLESVERMISVNVLGTVRVCRGFLPAMQGRGSGCILNTSSLGGLIGLYGYCGYCASKFAVIGFSEALRREVAPFGVSVSVLCPPNTNTPGLLAENRIKPAEVLAQESKVRAVDPAAVAGYVAARLPRRPSVIIPTLDGRAAWFLSRWAPWLLDRFLRRPTPAGGSG